MKAKKSLGQNFLKDETVLANIANLFSSAKNDLILEIGPGMGALTKYLVQKKSLVVAFEIDERMKEYLSKLDNLEVFYEDFLKSDLTLLKKYNYNNLYITANIPYYITTPIIEHILKNTLPKKMILLVQKEVALRFCALPNTKDYGYFTVYLNHYFNCQKQFDVKPECFEPIPKVTSSVIVLDLKEKRENLDEKKFFNFVKLAFQQKRKTLKNNLKEYWFVILPVLLDNGYSVNVRAEELSYEMFVKLYKEVMKKGV